MTDLNQAEHRQISTALDVEKLDENLFRSKALWIPARARGVFGGQVISQALVSATNCVESGLALHSLHCYFLTSASSATPIVYHVERLRNGRSYVARFVKAVQNGQTIFVLLCSFQKPELWQPSHQWTMPAAPPPEDCELEEIRYNRMAEHEGIEPAVRAYYREYAEERARSPVAVKIARTHFVSPDSPSTTYMYWMQARNIPKYEAPFQKCILSYLSDLYLIMTAARVLGLRRFSKGPNALAMTSTIDHSIYFYDNDFDCGEWLLYVMTSPRTGSGRGVVHGRIYTREGTLVAVTSQEGVVRADRKGLTNDVKL